MTLERISIDPVIRFGKPCVTGTRITVDEVLGFLDAGGSETELINNYPQLTREDVIACVAFSTGRRR